VLEFCCTFCSHVGSSGPAAAPRCSSWCRACQRLLQGLVRRHVVWYLTDRCSCRCYGRLLTVHISAADRSHAAGAADAVTSAVYHCKEIRLTVVVIKDLIASKAHGHALSTPSRSFVRSHTSRPRCIFKQVNCGCNLSFIMEDPVTGRSNVPLALHPAALGGVLLHCNKLKCTTAHTTQWLYQRPVSREHAAKPGDNALHAADHSNLPEGSTSHDSSKKSAPQ
jgi:hypothetical protein